MTYRLTDEQLALLDPSWRNFDFSQAGSSADATLNSYAQNLSPDQLASLQSGASGYGFAGYADSAGGSGQDIDPSKAGLSGYAMFAPNMNSKQGGWQNYYDPNGGFLGQHYNEPQSKALTAFDTATEALLAYLVGGVALGAAGGPTLPGIGSGAESAAGAANGSWDVLPDAVGSGADTSSVLSKAALDGTNVFGANSVPGALDVTDLVNAAPGIDSQEVLKDMVANLHAGDVSGLDLNSDIATQSGTIPDGSINTGVHIGSGPFFNTSPLQLTFDPGTTAGSTFGLKPTDVIKLITTAVNAGSGSGSGSGSGTGGTGTDGTKQPFDYGPARWMPAGWRQDRPMYVPGKDAIPDGWYGAGYTQG